MTKKLTHFHSPKSGAGEIRGGLSDPARNSFVSLWPSRISSSRNGFSIFFLSWLHSPAFASGLTVVEPPTIVGLL